MWFWRLEAACSLHIQASSCLLCDSDVWKQRIASIFKRQAACYMRGSDIWKQLLASTFKRQAVRCKSGSDVWKQLIAPRVFKRQALRLWAFPDVSNEPNCFIFYGHAAWTARPLNVETLLLFEKSAPTNPQTQVTFQKCWVLSSAPMRNSNLALPKTIDSLWRTEACRLLSCRYRKHCTTFTPDYLTLPLLHIPPPTRD